MFQGARHRADGKQMAAHNTADRASAVSIHKPMICKSEISQCSESHGRNFASHLSSCPCQLSKSLCVSGQALMAAYDTDGGGTLSAEELQRMGAQGGRIFMADGDVSRSDSLRGHIDNRQLLCRLRKS